MESFNIENQSNLEVVVLLVYIIVRIQVRICLYMILLLVKLCGQWSNRLNYDYGLIGGLCYFVNLWLIV